jgi:hypothetical protein
LDAAIPLSVSNYFNPKNSWNTAFLPGIAACSASRSFDQ